MRFERCDSFVGEIRGYRWWRVSPRGWLRSAWHCKGRWVVGDNVARCLRPDRGRSHHAEGSPNLDCSCGFYALHDIPRASPEELCPGWKIAATSSGTSYGLVFGVVAAHGHILIGTTGWRAEIARIAALYMGPEGRKTARLNAAARRYQVPVYRDLDALEAEWGPERGVSQGTWPELTA
jgi:hypothetical protein